MISVKYTLVCIKLIFTDEMTVLIAKYLYVFIHKPTYMSEAAGARDDD